MNADFQLAADSIRSADALLITAGAGMGVDSGLPDFRGNEGFWNAYPRYRHLGLSFVDLANPSWFTADPPLAWGFYGHRLELYRRSEPHAGFARLRQWGESRNRGFSVFTSNVDGQFQKSGFPAERVVECHGSIHHLQCSRRNCSSKITSADGVALAVDPETMRATAPFPTCQACGAIARPNVLMFGDTGWDGSRTERQEAAFEDWFDELVRARAQLVIVECGAGTAVPTVRHLGERLALHFGATLVRINVREPDGPPGTISLPLAARETIEAIDLILSK